MRLFGAYLAAGILICPMQAVAAQEVIAESEDNRNDTHGLTVQDNQVASVVIEETIGSVRLAKTGDELGDIRYGWTQGSDHLAITRFSRTKQLRNTSGSDLTRPSSLPLAAARLTGRFGYRRHPISGRNSHHNGIDLAASHGTPVAATMDGIVTFSGRMNGYGIVVKVRHENGLETRYAHLSGVAVSANQQIEQGQIIGYVGSTGRSTGPHLHYEVRHFGTPVDPLGG